MGANTTTQGDWQGVYGEDGYDLIGDLSSLPSYADVTTTNAISYIWSGSTTDVRALAKADPGATDRIAACWYNTWGQFSINIDLTDGNTHVVTLYADDWDNLGRSERVDLIDPATGNVLDSRTISSFTGGAYLSWDLKGDVELLVTPLAGPNAVISGIFFGQVNSATFVAANTTTQGNWKGVYGGDGYDVVGNQSSLPSYAEVTTTNASSYVWSSSTSDVRALAKATPGATDRVAACWYNSAGQFSININLTDGQTHVVTIYADDWDNLGRSERVDVIDPSTGTVLDSRTISSFAGGVYLSWQLRGDVQLLVTLLSGLNPVISGVFFGNVNSAAFVSTNTTTQGNWKGVYGSAGYDVIGNPSSLPSYAEVTTTNTTTYIWNSSTTDVRALQQATSGATARIAACWYNSAGQFSVNINLIDGQTHLVSIYALDWDNLGRIRAGGRDRPVHRGRARLAHHLLVLRWHLPNLATQRQRAAPLHPAQRR